LVHIISWETVMRIAVIGPQYPDSFARCISEALDDMGHQVIKVEDKRLTPHLPLWLKYTDKFKVKALESCLIQASPRFEKWVYRRLIPIIHGTNPELIINVSGGIPPEIIDKVRRNGCKMVLWFPDSVGYLGRQYLVAADYDAFFLKDPSIVKMMREKFNKNAHYLPECCMPKWHKKVELSDKDTNYYGCDITTAGSLYYYRARIFEHLMDYNLKIWGPPPPSWLRSPVAKFHTGRYVAELDKAKAFIAAKIVLNTFGPTEVGVNARTFEVAGCGAFQICEYRPGIKDFFKIDKEIVTYKTLKELRDKVEYYLAHPEERTEISNRAYKKAQQEHTYYKRLEKLIDIAFSRIHR